MCHLNEITSLIHFSFKNFIHGDSISWTDRQQFEIVYMAKKIVYAYSKKETIKQQTAVIDWMANLRRIRGENVSNRCMRERERQGACMPTNLFASVNVITIIIVIIICGCMLLLFYVMVIQFKPGVFFFVVWPALKLSKRKKFDKKNFRTPKWK